MAIYRKIYEQHFGPIPKDEDGRSYEIHHIDGNSSNNDIINLKCVTIQEHFNIHLEQGDWAACLLIVQRLNVPQHAISNIARKAALKRVANGNHNLTRRSDGTSHSTDRVRQGTHHFLGGEIQRRNNLRRVAEGKHNFQDSEATRARTYRQLANGKHASQIMKTCEHCQKEVDSANYSRWHGSKCKHAP